MKISPLMGSSKDRISVDCSDKAINLTEQVSVTPTFQVLKSNMCLSFSVRAEDF